MAASFEGVSGQQIRDFKDVFNMFDMDGDGSISGAELGTVMRSLGENPSEEELEQMVADADIDGNGVIDFAEFVGMMANKMKGLTPEEELRETFKVFDKTSRGKISPEELRAVILSLGESVTDDELNEMVREVDTNGDGFISYKEFEALMAVS